MNLRSGSLKKLFDRFLSLKVVENHVKAIEARTLARSQKRLKKIGTTNSGFSVRKILAYVFLMFFASFYIYQISRYLDWPPKEYLSDKVFNLTNQEFEWSMYVGRPKLCDRNTECQLLRDWSSPNIRKVVLPHDSELDNYTSGDIIYYRANITLPKRVFSPETHRENRIIYNSIMLHSLYIWALRYDVFINGSKVIDGGRQELYFPIPLREIDNSGSFFITIRVDSSGQPYQGITNLGDILIGPKYILDNLKSTQLYQQYTYFLLYLFPPLAYGILFSFFFLSLSFNKEQFAFAVYSFFNFLLVLPLAGDLFDLSNFNVLFEYLLPFKEAVLVYFLQLFLRMDSKRDYVTRAFAFGLAFVVCFWDIFFQQLLPIQVDSEFLRNVLLLFTMSYGLLAVGSTLLFLLKRKISSPRKRVLFATFTFFLAAVGVNVLIVLGQVPHEYQYFTRMNIDLGLYTILAIATGLDFGGAVVQRQFLEKKFVKISGPKASASNFLDQNTTNARDANCIIMFTDIRDFTQYSDEHTADEAFNYLNQYYGIVLPIIRDYSGEISTFQADGILCYWEASRQNAALALLTAIQVRREVLNNPILNGMKVGFGIHVGNVALGNLGDADRFSYSIIGDSVNTASRLESACKTVRADIVVSEELKELSGDLYYKKYHNFEHKGKANLVNIYKVYAFEYKRVLHAGSEKLADIVKRNQPGELDIDIDILSEIYESIEGAS